MHAIRDALNLGKVIESLRESYPNGAQEALESYHQEILERGGRAIMLSRNAHKHNRKKNAAIVAWGNVATYIPEGNVSLEQCKP